MSGRAFLISRLSSLAASIIALFAFCSIALAQAPASNNQSAAALDVRSIGSRINVLLQSAEQIGGPAIGSLRDALEKRFSALSNLIETDPALALELQLPEETSVRIRAISAELGELVEKTGSWQGHLNVMVEDNFEQRKSKTLYQLLLADSSLDLHFAGRNSPATCAEQTSVRGMRLGGKVAVASFQQSPAVTTACGPAGNQNVAAIYAQYPNTSFGSGATLAFVQNNFFGTNTRSLNDFWLENSNGITAASGTVVGPVTLDSDYSSCDSNQILSAAIQAADSSIDFRNFQRIFVVVPARSGCSFGIGMVGCGTFFSPSKGYLPGSWTVVTVDSNPAPNSLLSFIAHEGGHNLGLNHSSSLDYGAIPLGPLGTAGVHDEYGDFFSNMGVSYTYNGTTLIGHYAAQQKLMLNWLALGSSIQQVETDGTYLIAPYESPNSGVKALRIRRGAGNNQWIWMEYRQPIGNYDPTLAALSPNIFSGALIRYEDPNYMPDHTHLLDFHPHATPNDFSDAPLNIGSSWSDPYSPTTVRILSSSAMGLLVSLSYDSTVCSYSLSQGSPVSNAGGDGSVSVSTSAACGWNATTNAAWISITGGAMGTGPGTISFSASPNNGGPARSGSITVAGQNISITQAGAPSNPPVSVSVSPSSGSGTSQSFTATYTAGGAPINLVYFLVNSAVISPMSCFVEYNPGTNGYRLLNDAGTTWSASVPVGTGSASNGQCTISGAGGGATLAGNNLTVNFPITFNSAYAGAQNVFLYAADSSGQNSGWQQLGTWTVPGTGGTLPPGAIAACGQSGGPCVASLMASNGSGPSGTFTAVFTHPGGAGQHALGYILFLPTPNIVWYTATGSCLVEYNRISNAMRLINDAGTGWLPGTLGTPLSQGGTLANSHCTLDVTHSSASINGNLMTVAVKVTFASGFTGQLATFLQAFDMSGNFTSMTQFGNWMAAPAGVRQPGPYVVGVGPTSGAGSSTTLTFTAGHTSGVPALSFVTMLISSVIAGGVPCQVFYFQTSNTLNLVNDGGTAMVSTTGIPPGTAGTLANSRCSINTGGATSAVAGNNVAVSVPMTFQAGAFGGTKNVYVNAFDNYGLLSHWVSGGSWTVQ